MATGKDGRRTELSDLLDALEDEPIGPDDSRYFAFHEAPGAPRGDDAVRRLFTGIVARRKGATSQIFSGFRGAGKSTELRRLRKNLEDAGYRVILAEGAKYINLHQPLEITDLLLSIAAAVASSLESSKLQNPAKQTFATRVVDFFRNTNVQLSQFGVEAGVDINGAKLNLAKLVFNLSSNPSFKIQIQDVLRGRLDEFVQHFRAFMVDAREALGCGKEERCPVLIIDDLEKIRGSGPDQDIVQRRMETIFWTHHWALRIEGWHTLWTAPPYLQMLNPSVKTHFDGMQVLPMIRLWDDTPGRDLDAQSMDAVRRCLKRRGPIESLFMSDVSLDRLILSSSGRMRDLMALLRNVVMSAFEQKDPREPLSEPLIEKIIDQHAADYRKALFTEDIPWLREVARTRSIQPPNEAFVTRAAKLLDTAFVLTYKNGDEWVDVNLAIRAMVEKGA